MATPKTNPNAAPVTPNMLDPYWGLRLGSPLDRATRDWLRELLPPEHNDDGSFAKGRLRQTHVPPRAYQFRTLVAKYLKRLNLPVDAVIEQLFEDLMRASRAGDVGATKLLLERLCGKEAEQIDVSVEVSQLPPEERVKRIQALLTTAARRRIGVEGSGLLPAPIGDGTLPG